MTEEKMQELKSKIEDYKVSLGKKAILYDDIYCICHHREYAEMKLETFPNAIDYYGRVSELFNIKSDLLHHSIMVFHNFYRHILHHEDVSDIHKDALASVFAYMILCVENTYSIIYNLETKYVKDRPSVEIDSDAINNDFVTDIDYKNLPVTRLFDKICELHSKIYKTYTNEFKPLYESTMQFIDKKWGFVPDVVSLYRYVLYQINFLAEVFINDMVKLFQQKIEVDTPDIGEEGRRPWLIVKYLNLLLIDKSLESLKKALNVNLSLIDSEESEKI